MDVNEAVLISELKVILTVLVSRKLQRIVNKQS